MLKTVVVISVFAVLVLASWAINPVLGVVVAFFGYGAIDGILTE